MRKSTGHGIEAMLAAALVLLVSIVFHEAPQASFVNFDDPDYVTENEQVKAGITLAGVRWAFATTHASNWHPLTWLSHMLDCTIFGVDPGKHHLVSLLIHLANTLLWYFLWRSLTGRRWGSFSLAALFAVHPLHVESVLWIAERKDVLSTFFGLLALICYVAFARRRAPVWYGAALGLFAIGLLAKPMLVTLPILLFLLDFWPLGRPLRLLREKGPFLVLALVSGIATFSAQRSGGAVKSMLTYPLSQRFENMLVSYTAYLGKMCWPTKLSVFYPHPAAALPPVNVLGATCLLAAISAAAWRLRNTRPYLIAGWCWYLITLMPVIGLIQVGNQAMADRYTYVPLMGVFLVVVWGVGDALGARWGRTASTVAVTGCLLLLGFAAARRVGDWHDSIRLFQSAVAANPDNWLAHENLGQALVVQTGNAQEALDHYQTSIRLLPGRSKTYNFMGVALGRLGRNQESILAYREAVRLQRNYPEAWFNLGLAYISIGNPALATEVYRQLHQVDREWAARLGPFISTMSRR